MFNRTVIVPWPSSRTEYVTREVHEHRAPTDESVALLKEFEEKALAKVERAIRIEDNGFIAVVHAMRDFQSQDQIMKAVYSLNGKRIVSEVRVSDRDGWENDIADKLVKEVAEDLAREILRPAFMAALNGMRK